MLFGQLSAFKSTIASRLRHVQFSQHTSETVVRRNSILYLLHLLVMLLLLVEVAAVAGVAAITTPASAPVPVAVPVTDVRRSS